MLADVMKRTLARRFKKQKRAVYYELGLNRRGRLRADVFALAMTGHIIVVEVKSSVADFRADKKMHGYVDYCNKFYLAVTAGVYAKIKTKFDIPGAGVFILSEEGDRIVKVLPARNREIETEIVHNLAIRAAFRNSDTNNRKNVRA